MNNNVRKYHLVNKKRKEISELFFCSDNTKIMEYTNNEILTVEEVADILYVGKNTVYALLQSGALRAFRIGKSWRIPRFCLEEYIINKSKGDKD